METKRKTIVATLVTGILAVSAVVAACAEPTAPAPGAVAAPPEPSSVAVEYRSQGERQLDEAQSQTLRAMVVNTSASSAERAGINTVLDQIESAQRTLSGINEAQGMLMATMVNQGASTDEINVVLEAMENARQEVLARVGLSR